MGAARVKYAFSAEDLFSRMPNNTLPGASICYKYKNRKELAANIFRDCFHQIILDIINNNVTFVMPLRYGKYGELSMQQITDEEFKKAYLKGAFNYLDYVKTNFTGNRLCYRFKSRGRMRSKPLYVDRELRDLITNYTYEGKQYY